MIENLALGFGVGLAGRVRCGRPAATGPRLRRHPGASALAVRAGRRVCRLRGGRADATRQRADRGLRGAIVLGVRRPDVRRYFERQAADIVELVKLGIFVVFGLAADPPRPVRLRLGGGRGGGGHLLVARPVAVFAALAGTRTDTATRAFMSWFGPKGVATMTFSCSCSASGSARGSDDLQPGRADGVLLDHRPRRDRHAGGGVIAGEPARSASRRAASCGRLVPSLVPSRSASPPRIHDPAQEHREQDEGDESADQRPVHGANIYRGRRGARVF